MGKFGTEIRWGIQFSIALIIWAIIEKSIGLYDDKIADYALYTNLFGIIAIALYVFAIREKKYKFYDGKMTWRQGFVSGVYLTVVITVLTPICQVIIHKFVAPEFLPNLVDYKVATGYFDRKSAESYFNLESAIYQSCQFTLSMGIVTSAAVAYFLKTKNYQQ